MLLKYESVFMYNSMNKVRSVALPVNTLLKSTVSGPVVRTV